MKNARLMMTTRVRGRAVYTARGGCATSPPTIANNDKMRVWQTYGRRMESYRKLAVSNRPQLALSSSFYSVSRTTTPLTTGSTFTPLPRSLRRGTSLLPTHHFRVPNETSQNITKTLSVVGRTFTRLRRIPEYPYSSTSSSQSSSPSLHSSSGCYSTTIDLQVV